MENLEYKFNPEDEYLFYPEPLSRANSFECLLNPPANYVPNTDKEAYTKIYNPQVRKEIAKTKSHRPWFLGFMSIIQVIICGLSFYYNWKQTGSVIALNPLNYMIGPANGILITMGARYVPCMKSNTGYEVPNAYFTCPAAINGTGPINPLNDERVCFLKDVCSFAGGAIHIAFNMALQINVGFPLERLTSRKLVGGEWH
ncbi:hypothetical protein HDV02_004755 [Globomyces sp. JEL0801]|nr:hypothetical protein HDV02_004755 [Globomyces sp. JEL0801]